MGGVGGRWGGGVVSEIRFLCVSLRCVLDLLRCALGVALSFFILRSGVSISASSCSREVVICTDTRRCRTTETTTFIDPFRSSLGRSTCPDTGTPEHGYMKLPNRKIIRIRHTIYEDPGNPFADDDDDDDGPISPFTTDSRDRFLVNSCAEFSRHDSGDSLTAISPGRRQPRGPRRSLTDPTALQTCYLTSDKIADIASLIRTNRRSKSFAFPASRNSDESSIGEYVSPRRSWKRDGVPVRHLSETAAERPAVGEAGRSARDTRFYGFYEELIGEILGKRE